MIGVHTYSKATISNGMFNLTKHLVIVGMRLNNLNGSCARSYYAFQLLILAHAHPMHGIR